MRRAIVLYGSSRENGNTEYLADLACKYAKDIEFHKIYLRRSSIHSITDQRHSQKGFTKYDDEYYAIMNTMLSSDLIIFATPVYWYNMSTYTKVFIDRWTESLRDASLDMKNAMKDKILYVICTGANPNEEVIYPMIDIFRYTAHYFQMTFAGYLWANADQPGDILHDQKALSQAKSFFDLSKK